MNKDTDKIDEICAVFIKSLIQNKMDETTSYTELAKRVSNLIEIEMLWKFTHEENQTLMDVWHPWTN